LLQRQHPGLEVTLLEMSTEGDRFLQAPLSQIGGKGLFVKEIEAALLEGAADLAVHSLKDMTSHLPDALCLAVLPEREDPRDAFVSPRNLSLEEVLDGETIGTSSLRRTSQLLARRPGLRVTSVRGNVQTRLRKTVEGGWAGTLLALAGLKRLGLEAQVTQVLSLEESLPAVGQGVLALQCRTEDAPLRTLLAPLEHRQTREAVDAERAFLARLEGGCTVPLAGHAIIQGQEVWIRGLIGSPDGQRIVRGERRGVIARGPQLGRELAEALLAAGGDEILKAHANAPQVSPP
jgi:hydroxymethylbilane synthase